jgi:hypothetical protein
MWLCTPSSISPLLTAGRLGLNSSRLPTESDIPDFALWRYVPFGINPHHTSNNNVDNTEVTTGRQSWYVKLTITNVYNKSLCRQLTWGSHTSYSSYSSAIDNHVSSVLIKINFPFARSSSQNFHFSISSRLALAPTHPSIQWEPGLFPGGKAARAWSWPLASN